MGHARLERVQMTGITPAYRPKGILMNPTYDFTGQVALVTGGQFRDGTGHRPRFRSVI